MAFLLRHTSMPGARMTSRTGRGDISARKKSSSGWSASTESMSTVKPKSMKLLASEHMLRLHSSSWRRASSVGFPMNQTKPLPIMRLTSSPPTRAARGSKRAASRVTVVLPAPGIPDTITPPDSSPLVIRAIVPIIQLAPQSGCRCGSDFPCPIGSDRRHP
jgi:hypothetical protein